jgi:hypothetical protein
MGVLRGDEAASVTPITFTGRPDEATTASPMAFKRVDADGAPVREPEPAPVVETKPPPPPEPAPAPVFDIPGDLLQAFYDQAVAQGLEDGKNQVLAELTILQARYAAALDQLVDLSKELEAHNQLQIVHLACRVAERLVRHEISVNPIRLFELVAEALQHLEGVDEATIYCSPPDHGFLVERREALAAGVGASFRVRVVADGEMDYGDFRIETRLGSTDGLVASRVAEVEAALAGEGGDV